VSEHQLRQFVEAGAADERIAGWSSAWTCFGRSSGRKGLQVGAQVAVRNAVAAERPLQRIAGWSPPRLRMMDRRLGQRAGTRDGSQAGARGADQRGSRAGATLSAVPDQEKDRRLERIRTRVGSRAGAEMGDAAVVGKDRRLEPADGGDAVRGWKGSQVESGFLAPSASVVAAFLLSRANLG
jgi:hypothetical protein